MSVAKPTFYVALAAFAAAVISSSIMDASAETKASVYAGATQAKPRLQKGVPVCRSLLDLEITLKQGTTEDTACVLRDDAPFVLLVRHVVDDGFDRVMVKIDHELWYVDAGALVTSEFGPAPDKPGAKAFGGTLFVFPLPEAPEFLPPGAPKRLPSQ